MTGSILNAAGIVLGGIAGLTVKKQLPAASQNYLKIALGAGALFIGLRLTWQNVNGTIAQAGKQVVIILLALILGRLAGRLLRLQHISNRLGQSAREHIARTADGRRPAWSVGVNTCAALFCAAPLAVIGAAADGLNGDFAPLAIKTAMDALAAMSFAAMFGWSAAAAALPVFGWQGTLTLLCSHFARPLLAQHGLLDPVNATAGMLLVYVAVVILEVRKVELADYLPSLAVAPLLAWLWR